MAIASAQPNNQSKAAPGRQAGKSLLANIVIIALLVLAVFFYVRSVAPP
ncbi:MAG: hypothetical protein RLZ44_1027, partial [Pseudomonadota bacterium]